MTLPAQKEEYSSSFPSEWIDGSSPKRSCEEQRDEKSQQQNLPSPANHHPPEHQADSPRPPESSQPSEAYKARALATRNVTSQDSTSPKTEPSTPTSKGRELRGKGNATPADNYLEVPKARVASIKPKHMPPHEPEYSTVYPSSWSISSNNPIQTFPPPPAAVPPSTSLPGILSVEHSGRMTSTTSSGSHGDALPISPINRRLRKGFSSMYIPRDGLKIKGRATSSANESQFRDTRED
jgi:hypothetical protein